MSILLASGILTLLLLAWLPAGLVQQSPHTISVSLGSKLTLQCLPRMRPRSAGKGVVWCSTQYKKDEMVEKVIVETHLHRENGSFNFTFTSVNETHIGNYTCWMSILPCVDVKKQQTCPCKSYMAPSTHCKELCGQTKASAVFLLCTFVVWLENKTMHVRWGTYPELHEDTLEHCKVEHSDASHGTTDAASTEPTVCDMSSRSFTGAENATRGTAPSSDPETSSTREPQTHEDLIAIIYMYAIPGLVLVTLFFLLCILVCLCRRSRKNAKGNPESKHAAEMNQLSTPPPAPQTEDVTYAKLIFEKTGTIPAASEVVYTEIKPLQKK